MTKQTMQRTMNAVRNLKSAVVWMLMVALVWNSAALPLAASSRDRRSSKPSPKPAAKLVQGGGSFVIWGPQQVVRQPINTTYYANFPLPAGAIPPYTMTVSNGAPDGTRKVTQACVKLNGANVLSPTCYHSLNPTPQTRTVSLLADNAVQVALIGPSLSYITITVTGSQASFTLNPTSGNQAQTLSVTLTGTGTNWVQGQTAASFGSGGGGEITVNSLTINSATSATAQIAISATAALGPRTVTMTTGAQLVSAVDAFTVNTATPPGFASSTVSTLAGSANNPGFTNGTGATARFRNLAGLAAAPNDVVYVADAGNHAIRRVDSAGVVTTVAGSGSPGFLDGQGAAAQFNNPQGVAIDSSGNLYVADSGNHVIRRIDAAGNVTTIAGDGTAGFVNGSGAAARFNNPRGIAVDAANRIFVADTGNHAVRRIDAGNAVTTLAGDGTAGATDSPGARFNGLAGIVVEGAQVYVYLADTGNHRIRRLDSTNTVITLAGFDRGFKDGTAAQSRFADPSAVALDGSGHVIIADTTNSLVRDVDPVKALNGNPLAVITLAGTGVRGATNGAGNVAQFNKPAGVAVAPSSAVLVADTANHSLRKILLPPTIASLSPSSGNAGAPVTITGTRFDERGPSFNTVRFAASGGGTVTASVTLATRTQLNVTVPAGAVTVQTAGGTSNGVTFTINAAQPPTISDFNPKSGPVGTLVTITGTNLKVGTTDPAVTFAGAGSPRLPAQVAFASAAEVRATAPNAAVTGVIQLTTSAGLATTALPFTVTPSQDYTITLAPSSASVVQGSTATFVVSVTSPQTTFTQLVKLSVSGLPSGALASFSPEQITAGATSTLTVRTASSLSPTSYSFSVNGTTKVDGSDLNRSVGGSISVLAAGQTTLAGRVLSTESEPVMGATVSLDGQTATTNAAGSFILSGISAGTQRAVMVDGRTANAPGRSYPVIVEPADISAGQANVVPYTFYLPAIDTQYEVTVVPTQTTAIGNPRVTNLTMTIPANANLRNRDGSLVTRASITPVAIDRTPAPLPSNLGTTLVYTAQPGGACIMNAQNQCTTSGAKIPVVYPNLAGASPGTSVPLYSFNHDTAVWYKYGDGTVSADGKTIVPNAGVGLSDFSWHFPVVSPDGPSPNDSCPVSQGDHTVDYATGLKIERMTDISFGGARGGLSVSRTFTTDLANPVNGVYRFGVGFKDNYDIRLTGAFQANGAGRVVWPEQLNGRLFSYDALLSGGGVPTFTSTRTTGQLGDTVRRINSTTLEYRSTAGVIMRFEAHPNGQYYRLKTIVDRNGNTATLTYDASNNLTSATDAVGRSITFAYNAPNCAECIRMATDPLGRVTTYSYNASKQLTQVTDALGKTMSYAYGAFGSALYTLTSVTDRRGNVVKQLVYDANRRVISQTFADGGTEQYSYTLSGTVVTGVTIIDPLGRKMTKRFNSAGYVIEETDGLGQQSKIERNLTTNLATKTTGPCGCLEAERTFDTRGNVTSIKDRLNKTESWQYRTFANAWDYDPLLNQATQYTDKRGNTTSYGYDAVSPNSLLPRGNMTTMTDARLKVTTYTYDFARGAVTTRVTDPLNNKRDFDYDANGFMNSEIVRRNSDQAVISQTTYEFDLVGNTKKVTDGEGRITTMNYDALNRMTGSTDPANATTVYGYDENSNQTSVTDALNRQWTSSYDNKDRPISTTDALPVPRVTRWQYDAADQLLKVISPSGRVMRYEYDERGQRKTMTDGLGNVVTFSYENRGNLKTLADQRGNTTVFEHDELFRLVSQRDPLGRLTRFEYDDASNIKAKVDRLGRRTDITYDMLNRPQQAMYADTVVTYGYDDAYRWTSVSDAAGTITWGYDEANRVKTETTNLGVIQYDYNKANQRKTMIAADRAPVNYGFDAAGRLQTIAQGSETFTYGYDTISRRTSLARPNGVATSYEYDQVDRLKRLRHVDASSVALEDLQYEFNFDDEINKITSLASAPLVPTSKSVTASDAANRIGQFGAASLGFDAEGQTTSKTDTSGATAYQWDARGRLTQATLPNGQTVSYGFDALGRRTNRAAGGSTTTFQHDGVDVVIDRVTSGIAVDYLNGLWIDDKLRQAGGANGTLYYLQDHLGSTSALTSTSGALVEQQQYEIFGANSGSVRTRHGYTGRERDELTGLIYYRARWYDADQSRFISEDPILFFAGGENFYAYVLNNPVSLTDPYGLNPIKLPPNPGPNGSNLPGWTPDTTHQNPKGSRWISPDGKHALEFESGTPGEKGWRGKDHWHKYDRDPKRPGRWIKDNKGGDHGHHKPGDEIPDVDDGCPVPSPSPTPQPQPETPAERRRKQIEKLEEMRRKTPELIPVPAPPIGRLIPILRRLILGF